MTIDEAIEYQKRSVHSHEVVFGMGDEAEDTADLAREKALLGFLEELKWYRQDCPAPTEVAEMVKELSRLPEVLASTLTRPRFYDGCWWLDIVGDHKCATLEFNRTRGGNKPWGVSLTSGIKKLDEDPSAGAFSGPDEVFATTGEALEQVKSFKLGERDPAYGPE